MKRIVGIIAGYYLASDALLTTLVWSERREGYYPIRIWNRGRGQEYPMAFVSQRGRIVNLDKSVYHDYTEQDHNTEVEQTEGRTTVQYELDPENAGYVKKVPGLSKYHPRVNPDPNALVLTDKQLWFQTWKETNLVRLAFEGGRDTRTKWRERKAD